MDKIIDLTIVTKRHKARFDAWAEDNSGATAVEFALIATPFFFLIFGLMEISLIFILSTTLEFGLNEASRDIRTGSFQNGSAPNVSAFRTSVCSNLFALLDCSDLFFDVRAFTNFPSGPPPDPRNPTTGQINPGSLAFQPGAPSEIVLVRAYFEWDLITPVISLPLANTASGNSRLLEARIAFQNEPFNVAP